ncbi:unnamed protein product [[Candida] boidinii]|nr:unnamed protein product [[Candida] boidinii]
MAVNCGICKENPFKYKCPKCGVSCSLICFKSPEHKHEEINTETKQDANSLPQITPETTNKTETAAIGLESKENQEGKPQKKEIKDEVILKLLQNEKFKSMLNEPVVQYYILILNDILKTVSVTNEYNREGRLEIANKKLSNLREGGVEHNDFFDEFCEIILSTIE